MFPFNMCRFLSIVVSQKVGFFLASLSMPTNGGPRFFFRNATGQKDFPSHFFFSKTRSASGGYPLQRIPPTTVRCWMMRSWARPSSRSALSSAAFTRRGPARSDGRHGSRRSEDLGRRKLSIWGSRRSSTSVSVGKKGIFWSLITGGFLETSK